MGLVESSQRNEFYTWLSGIFLTPPAAEMRAIALNPEFHDGLVETLGEDAVADLKTWSASPTELEALHLDYDELFRIPKGRYVTPFESVYREPYVDGKGRQRRRLMGDCTQQVMRYYTAAGAEFSRFNVVSRMPDFIGAELSFMAWLCQAEVAAAEGDDGAQVAELQALQRRFVDEHLSQWVPGFCDTLAKNDAGGYYGAIAPVLAAHVAADHTWLLETVPAPMDDENESN